MLVINWGGTEVKCPKCKGKGKLKSTFIPSFDTGYSFCRYTETDVECGTCNGVGSISKLDYMIKETKKSWKDVSKWY